MQKAKGLYRGKIFGKRLWKMVCASGQEYYIGETRLPKWLGKILWGLYFWRGKK